jgi:hypothetical protein
LAQEFGDQSERASLVQFRHRQPQFIKCRHQSSSALA